MLTIVMALLWVGAQPARSFGDELPAGHYLRPSSAATATYAGTGEIGPMETAQAATARAALAAAPELLAKKQYPALRERLEPLAASEWPEVKWPAVMWLARALYQQGDVVGASCQFARVARNDETLAPQAHYWLGQAWVRRRRIKTARECFARAGTLAASDFRDDCLYQQGYTHYLEAHYEQAVALFGELLDQYPTSNFAASARRLLTQSLDRLSTARKAQIEWLFNAGVVSTTQVLKWSEGPELGLGASVQLGARINWVPRDGTQVAARFYGTRISYLTEGFQDRLGLVGGLSLSHDLGNTRTAAWGLSFSENQYVDLVASDSRTSGLYGSYGLPVGSSGRLSAGLSLSRLEYTTETSSGTQTTGWLSFSRPLARKLNLALGASRTDSSVGADYLSYVGDTGYVNLSRTINGKSAVRAGFAYTANDFNAPRPKATECRSDRTRSYWGEYTRPVIGRFRVTVGWQETSRTSTVASLNRSEPSWYLRTSQLVELKF